MAQVTKPILLDETGKEILGTLKAQNIILKNMNVGSSGGTTLGIRDWYDVYDKSPSVDRAPNTTYGYGLDKVVNERMREAILVWIADKETVIYLDEACSIPATRIVENEEILYGAFWSYTLYFDTIGLKVMITAPEFDDYGNYIENTLETAKDLSSYAFKTRQSKNIYAHVDLKTGADVESVSVSFSEDFTAAVTRGNVISFDVAVSIIGGCVLSVSIPLVITAAYPDSAGIGSMMPENYVDSLLEIDFNNRRIKVKKPTGSNLWEYEGTHELTYGIIIQ
jgi:hypothetical protein